MNYRDTLVRGVGASLLMMFFLSCVGTVDEKKISPADTVGDKAEKVDYQGLSRGVPIAHNKVEIFFPQAAGDPSNFNYRIYVNNSTIPIEINGSDLEIDYSGEYRYTVKQYGGGVPLKLNTSYAFRVEIYDIEKESESESEVFQTVTTFSNKTAEFDGISNLKVSAGLAGKDTIIVEWLPAEQYGTVITPNSQDVDHYEITYISEDGGGVKNLNNSSFVGGDRLTISVAADKRSRPISGLAMDTKYFVQVRAVHNGYIDNSGSDPNYKKEVNTKILEVTTLSPLGDINFEPSSLKLENPSSKEGLTKVDATWDAATGDFDHYRIYKAKVTSSSDADELTSDDIDTLNADITNPYIVVGANDVSERITNLDSYSWYQVKVAVCGDSTCTKQSRIESDLRTIRTVPPIVPFSGVTSIDSPEDETELDTLHIEFDPPVINSGYLTDLELYCYEGSGDNSPVLLEYNVQSNFPAKTPCHQWKLVTQSPASYTGWSSYDEIDLKLETATPAQDLISGTQYCFALVPVIDDSGGSGYVERDLDAAVVKCTYPEIITPRLTQFAGKQETCDISQDDLTINWNTPTGGIYSNFVVFWKEKDTEAFSLQKAIDVYEGNTVDARYNSIGGLNSGDTSYTINNLEPGKRYHTAVLTYVTSGGSNLYSEFNSRTGDCLVPLPLADFQEWFDIFAVGPKINGLVDPNSSVTDEYILETITSDGVPVEVSLNGDGETPSDANKRGTAIFNGIYGSIGANTGAVKHQYSNSGVVRLMWKDVTVYGGSQDFKDLISTYELGTPDKRDRTVGYKVYRSDDNKATWEELTSKDHSFQTVTNSGLLHPFTLNYYKRINEGAATEDVIEFVDYSVRFSEPEKYSVNSHNSKSERARVYWYKITPVFKGHELRYENEDSHPHHIVRVILPPANMAFVQRMMANRATCYELDKAIDTSKEGFYSCEYAGLGASPNSIPWALGTGRFDIGGDLIVDRFELGCNFTRGDIGDVASKYSGNKRDFIGENDSGGSFKGCFDANNGAVSDAGATTLSMNNNGTLDFNNVLQGDCIGEGRVSLKESICADHTQTNYNRPYSVPGMSGTLDCELPQNVSDSPGTTNYHDFFEHQMVQSEFGAVYKMRDDSTYKWSPQFRSVNNKTLSSRYGDVNNCMINLPFLDGNDSDKYKSRWIAINKLFDNAAGEGRLIYDNGGVDEAYITLYDQTISDILSNSLLYDGTDYKAPSYIDGNRLPSNMPLIKALVSNNSKLPPADGFSNRDLNNTCNLFEVEVGFEPEGENFSSLKDPEPKRLMRRKEFLAASFYPQTYDDSKVLEIEDGSFQDGGDNKSCNVYDKFPGVSGQGLNSGISYSPTSAFESGASRPYLFTGSSSQDSGSNSRNTEMCVSRFGVQDLAGNFEEYTSDEIFCDTSSEHLLLGTSQNQATSKRFSGGDANWYNDDLELWVLSDPSTGRCSAIERGATRSTGSYISGGAINPTKVYGGVASFVDYLKSFDVFSIDDLRNADGFFLDFGQDHFGPPLNVYDTLAIHTTGIRSGDNRKGEYFNPVVGMTLQCANGGCDGVPQSASDNKRYTVEEFTDDPNTPGSESDPTQKIIFTGESQILNDGIKEVNTGTSRTFPNNEGGTFNFIDDVVADNPVDLNDGTFVMDSIHSSSMSSLVLRDAEWVVQRSGTMHFVNGGKARTRNAGRFNLHIRGASRASQSARRGVGGRCGVKIEYDY